MLKIVPWIQFSTSVCDVLWYDARLKCFDYQMVICEHLKNIWLRETKKARVKVGTFKDYDGTIYIKCIWPVILKLINI